MPVTDPVMSSNIEPKGTLSENGVKLSRRDRPSASSETTSKGYLHAQKAKDDRDLRDTDTVIGKQSVVKRGITEQRPASVSNM